MWDPKETIESVGLGKQERKRSTRVADAIRMELSVLFLQKVRDQMLHDVTVTGVTMTDDLRSACIMYTVPGNEKKQKKVADALTGAAGFMRSHLARVLNMRYTPSLQFVYDTKAEKVAEMEKLFQEIATERSKSEENL
ncbi:MAG: 30S ribosome-binding factor RbfA [Proteobacteria bacterium]|nr:30S ribosome-binding factor RbfA [Pseudomonadota bacterium]MBU1060867.1 30S ribosome-binding factor RbfA [Pseudomonadota bacterium]